jgi:hypothetical protein
MTFQDLVSKAVKLASDNSPAILTAIGVTGTITTAYLTGKASFKAARIIARVEQDSPEIETREKVQLVWKQYIPAVAMGTLTVTSIVVATRIGTRRAAALATAYSLSERAIAEYKDKVIEKIGANKELAVREEVAQDRVNTHPVSQSTIIMTTGGESLCYEQFTDRYFMSSMEALKKAQNDINFDINHHNYASLSEFYDKLGLRHTMISDDFGWNGDSQLDLKISSTISDDGRPCLAVNYVVQPIRDFSRLH